MVLADYDTDVEKIAALKAATLDPALVQVKLTSDAPYTATEDIFVFYSPYLAVPNLLGGYTDIVYTGSTYSSYGFNQKFESGNELISFNTVLFVKDSDIIYSDPIATYQKRLLTCLNTTGTSVYSTNPFTTGATGVILVNSAYLRNSENTAFIERPPAPFLPYPPGMVLRPYDKTIRYFDVPADW